MVNKVYATFAQGSRDMDLAETKYLDSHFMALSIIPSKYKSRGLFYSRVFEHNLQSHQQEGFRHGHRTDSNSRALVYPTNSDSYVVSSCREHMSYAISQSLSPPPALSSLYYPVVLCSMAVSHIFYPSSTFRVSWPACKT